MSVILLRQEFCLSSGFAYYEDDCDTQEKLKTILWMVDRARNWMVSVGAKDSRIEFPGVTSNPCNDFFFFRVAL